MKKTDIKVGETYAVVNQRRVGGGVHKYLQRFDRVFALRVTSIAPAGQPMEGLSLRGSYRVRDERKRRTIVGEIIGTLSKHEHEDFKFASRAGSDGIYFEPAEVIATAAEFTEAREDHERLRDEAKATKERIELEQSAAREEATAILADLGIKVEGWGRVSSAVSGGKGTVRIWLSLDELRRVVG